MRSNDRSVVFLACGVLVFAVVVCLFASAFAAESQTDKSTGDSSNGNSKCYVCHPAMKTEEVTTDHILMDITCDECHGPSTEHMHDEMLMTEPDLLFGRSEVKQMCSNPNCHKPGDGRRFYSLADHKDPEAAEAFYKKWVGRTRPNGRTVTSDSVCTDCHGKHNLDKGEAPKLLEQSSEWKAIFNGRDLTGWESSGDAFWALEAGRIAAEPAESGKSGTLWSDQEYEDYRFAITFRADWPVHAGIWTRGEGLRMGPRVEIFDSERASAHTGSVLVPGKGLALLNMREDLVDRESWNTLSIKVEGDRVQVWLNGEEIGAVRAAGPARGKIGLHIEKPAASKSGRFYIREILVQRLGAPEEPSK